MKKKIFLLLLLFPFFCEAQTPNPVTYGRTVILHLNSLKGRIRAASPDSYLFVDLPMPDGSIKSFRVNESQTLSPTLSAKFPELKSYAGVCITDQSISVGFDISPNGFHGTIKMASASYFIEPIDLKKDLYRLYNQKDVLGSISCGVNNLDVIKKNQRRENKDEDFSSNGTKLRTYRIAIAATGEFTQANGGTVLGALARINTIITAVNTIYTTELSIKFQLIDNEDTIIYTDPETDPFTPLPNGDADPLQSQSFFDRLNIKPIATDTATLPYSFYDIGHVLHTIAIKSETPLSLGANGKAGPRVCFDTEKGLGWSQNIESTSGGGETKNASIVSVLTHEIAHQFYADHTYNGTGSLCTGNRANATAFEPGSGSTIMSYFGNCATNNNLTGINGNYFHINSLDAITNTITSGYGACASITATNNTPPIANAGTNFKIPKGTPFTLIGSAIDTDNDVLTYSWEEYDKGVLKDAGALGNLAGVGGYAAVNSITAPLFRSQIPSTESSRTFPSLNFILNNKNNPADEAGEDLPQVARKMDFRLTVRDNKVTGGAYDFAEITVTVDDSGPLAVTLPNGNEILTADDLQIFTWNVNKTDILSPKVNILLSIDGGNTFSYVLANNTPNDGSESIRLPKGILSSTTARVKIVSTTNPTAEFFDISDVNFTINSTCKVSNTLICPTTPVFISQGSVALNLSMNNSSVAFVSSKTFEISVNSQKNNLIVGTNINCSIYAYNYSGTMAFRVSQTGSYTFSTLNADGYGLISIYSSNTYNCDSYIGSTVTKINGGYRLFPSLTLNLNSCTTYYLVILNNRETLPATNIINFSGVGTVNEIITTPANQNYTYAAIDKSTNKIAFVNPTGDFRALLPGDYSVYGVAYNGRPTFVGQTINDLFNQGNCIAISGNAKSLIVTCNKPDAPTLMTPANFCQNSTASLTVTGSNLLWFTTNDGIGSINTPTISTNIIGTQTYYVTQTVNNCVSNKAIINININHTPNKPTVDLSENTLKSSSSVGNQWYNNGTIVKDSTGQILHSIDSGAYKVRVTEGTCYTESDVFVITAIEPTVNDFAIKLYPNPSDNYTFSVELPQKFRDWQIDIFTLEGKQVFSKLHNEGTNTEQVNFKVSGNYILKVTANGQSKGIRLVVK